MPCKAQAPVRSRPGSCRSATSPGVMPSGRSSSGAAGALIATRPRCCAGAVWERFELLTTKRALGAAPLELAERATAVHQVEPGRGPVRRRGGRSTRCGTATLLALGGGRVIDTAKAIAAVRGGRVCALPTTLSGAEMTRIHRLPAGREHDAPHRVRPALVIADPFEMTTLDDRAPARQRDERPRPRRRGALRAARDPVATHGRAARRRLIATALDSRPADATARRSPSARSSAPTPSTRPAFALHHVVCQTLVRMLGTPHAETNATMLPRTMEAMRDRAPEADRRARAMPWAPRPRRCRARIEELGGGRAPARRARRPTAIGSMSARHVILARRSLPTRPIRPDRRSSATARGRLVNPLAASVRAAQ